MQQMTSTLRCIFSLSSSSSRFRMILFASRFLVRDNSFSLSVVERTTTTYHHTRKLQEKKYFVLRKRGGES